MKKLARFFDLVKTETNSSNFLASEPLEFLGCHIGGTIDEDYCRGGSRIRSNM